VIDVGSNSVRLVTYRLEGRSIWTVFNEKALAGLGRDLPATGRLSPQGVETAFMALRRFHVALRDWRPDDIFAVATAAVREAADGRAFLNQAREEIGLDIRLLSGEEEARFAGLGVIAGQPDAQGVAGDLGGSSLELIPLANGAPGDGATLPLGPFALGAPRALDGGHARKQIDAELKPLANRFTASNFHAVGGGWRNLAMLHMAMADYPLHVTHQYRMSRSEALDVARFAARQSKQSLERIEGLSKKRVDTLPYAAVVLEALVEALGVQQVVISAYGLREGILLDAMDPDIRTRDPLIEGCEALAAMRGLSHELAQPLEAWLSPAMSSLPAVFGARDATLRAAAARLADLGARLHPDHRADLVFEQVLRAPIAGMTHAERTFLASMAFSRHTVATTLPEPEVIARLLTPEQRQRARALGAAIRLGFDLSGRNPKLLEKSNLTIEGERLVLRAAPGWGDMLLGEQTAKRAASLASVLKLKLQMG
jgi:exopolyphosphatase/guanosine-5'-triphosphate,3'-diphosphate pyrophosphatase